MKKTMRKSALLSSVVMLLVSCIVLTSATYAWFSAARKVYVDTLTAGVQKASGLQISADGATYKTTVTTDELAGVANAKSVIPTTGTIKPVSTVDTTAFVTGEFDDKDQVTFETVDTTTDKAYYRAHVWLKAAEDMTVTLRDTNLGGATLSKTALKYAVVVGDNDPIFVAADGVTDAWTGIQTAGGTFSKNSTSGAADVGASGTSITPKASLSDVTISLTANNAVEVDVYLWLEGQDPQCTEAMANDAITIKLAFSDVNSPAALA